VEKARHGDVRANSASSFIASWCSAVEARRAIQPAKLEYLRDRAGPAWREPPERRSWRSSRRVVIATLMPRAAILEGKVVHQRLRNCSASLPRLAKRLPLRGTSGCSGSSVRSKGRTDRDCRYAACAPEGQIGRRIPWAGQREQCYADLTVVAWSQGLRAGGGCCGSRHEEAATGPRQHGPKR